MAVERVNIQQLTIRAPGLSPQDGKRLARLVGECLSRTLPVSATAGVHESVAARVVARPGTGVEALAENIAASIVRKTR